MKFSEIRRPETPERRARTDAIKAEMDADVAYFRLRRGATWRVVDFLDRHPRLRRAMPRPVRDYMAKRVWASLESIPGFSDRLRTAEAELAAGRSYILDTETGVTTPNPLWPKDGPQPRL